MLMRTFALCRVLFRPAAAQMLSFRLRKEGARATVVLVGTLDTKRVAYGCLRDCVRKHRVDVLSVDGGVLSEPLIEPDIAHAEVARAAGAVIKELGRATVRWRWRPWGGGSRDGRAPPCGGTARRDSRARRLWGLRRLRRRSMSASRPTLRHTVVCRRRQQSKRAASERPAAVAG